jgi:hypothetical protein
MILRRQTIAGAAAALAMPSMARADARPLVIMAAYYG